MKTSFEITQKEIQRAYSLQPTGKRIYFEFVSKYRRIVVLEDDGGYEINVTYKVDAREYNKDYTVRYGDLDIAIAWAKYYSENRNIYFGILTIKEMKGSIVIGN